MHINELGVYHIHLHPWFQHRFVRGGVGPLRVGRPQPGIPQVSHRFVRGSHAWTGSPLGGGPTARYSPGLTQCSIVPGSCNITQSAELDESRVSKCIAATRP